MSVCEKYFSNVYQCVKNKKVFVFLCDEHTKYVIHKDDSRYFWTKFTSEFYI
jgi:hypothetical protein